MEDPDANGSPNYPEIIGKRRLSYGWVVSIAKTRNRAVLGMSGMVI